MIFRKNPSTVSVDGRFDCSFQFKMRARTWALWTSWISRNAYVSEKPAFQAYGFLDILKCSCIFQSAKRRISLIYRKVEVWWSLHVISGYLWDSARIAQIVSGLAQIRVFDKQGQAIQVYQRWLARALWSGTPRSYVIKGAGLDVVRQAHKLLDGTINAD